MTFSSPFGHLAISIMGLTRELSGMACPQDSCGESSSSPEPIEGRDASPG